jgi:hypothetical protein
MAAIAFTSRMRRGRDLSAAASGVRATDPSDTFAMFSSASLGCREDTNPESPSRGCLVLFLPELGSTRSFYESGSPWKYPHTRILATVIPVVAGPLRDVREG